ncbi:ABC transporter ATP-binding protein [Pelodictyon phaeoclathratiforme]|uniref:ABC transporter related n=1 Tax=Pelodictyon phaeoclathratiforme (strain DSM 5477 / BU-1) TaxID=324925 RepID=B4SCK2_PELPB|nr:ABC transporter ATP-binding protein [Pelodictyon phaeoclathratiforme]ACF44207.1 ABC transporter related [Pelodictyon phaeoclathratiforme BU-1]MBV5288573.1 ABC transporter ATP-binding protein [Pelodictyon phaeoclathratiforme]
MIHLSVSKTLSGTQGTFELSVDLSLQPGTLQTLYGKSGSGKSTLLRILAGLVKPDSGHIEVNGQIWFDSTARINLPPQKRKVGLVFQDYSLFPTMTVKENLLFAQEKRDEQKVNRLLELTDLQALKHRYPATLSGGQQQRVALARAILREPHILLLDEPLSALDQVTRNRLQDEILNFHKRFRLTTILVSHDKQEVFKLSDTVNVLDRGGIIRSGTPLQVFLDRKSSNKFSFASTILSIRQVDCIYLAVIGAGNELVEVVLSESDIATLKVGDEVLVASKAFNPIVIKL